MTSDRDSYLLNSPDPVTLATDPGRPEQVHVFDPQSVLAVNAAFAARRPLLVRGEPGVGKTQLAAAVAAVTKRVLVVQIVDARTESRDLLWEFDAVRRLAEAQVIGALNLDAEAVEARLATRRFLRPGPLWWTFDWHSAEQQAKMSNSPAPAVAADADPAQGTVLLIDEIDKAESDVPNGLLESLGAGQFTPFGCDEPIVASAGRPFVIITTNEERVMPDAFLRRCMVLHLNLPRSEDGLIALLADRGKAHFPDASSELLQAAAELLVEDRTASISAQITPLPGQAEYLDLVRSVRELAPAGEEQIDLLKRVSQFALRKTTGTSS